MNAASHSQRIALAFGGLVIVGMAASATGCSPTKEKPAETNAPTQSSGSPAPTHESPEPTPTNKAAPTINPTGPNSFTPPVLAPPAPTALPGNVVTGR